MKARRRSREASPLPGGMGEWAGRGPLRWQEWTRRAVRVSAGGREYRGWVLTTDPVSAR